MGFLKNIFSKKEEEKPQIPLENIAGECPCCKLPVLKGEQISFDKKKFHKKCFRKNKRLAVKAYLG